MSTTTFDYRSWLAEQIKDRQAKNPAYSLRSFAKHLGMSAAHLSNIIANKRPLTLPTAQKIASRLNVDSNQRESLLNAIEKEKNLTKSQKATLGYRELKEQDFEIIDQWYYYAILGLASLPENKCDPAWLAKRLRISKLEAKSALNCLLKMGHIREVEGGGFTLSSQPILINQKTQTQKIQNFQKQIIDQGLRALEFDPVEEKLFSFRCLAFSPKYIPQVKEKIKQQQKELLDFITKNKLTKDAKVFALNTHFFSLDQGDINNEA